MSFNKNLYRKITAGVTALSMVFAATGCGETTSWIAKSNNVSVSSGVYIFYQTEAYSEATSILTKENEDLDTSDTKLLKTMTVEGTNISEWINDKAQKNVKIFTAVNEKFDELGLSLSDEEIANVDYTVEMYWDYYSDRYEVNGIGKESFRQLVEFDYKKEDVFLYYYGEGGEKECGDAEIASYLEGNYSRVKTIKFEYTDADGNTLDEDAKKDVKKMAEDYQKRANKGESFDDLVDEYSAYLEKIAEEAAAAAEEEAAEDESEEAAVTTAAEEAEAEVTTAAEDEDSAEVTTTAEEAEAAEEDEDESEEAEETTAAEDEEASDEEETESDEEEAAVTTAAEDEDSAEVTTTAEKSEEASEDEEETSEDEEETEADPYANETIYKKGSEDDGYSPSETVNKAIFEECLVDGDAELIEDADNNCIYLIKRLNIVDREDFFEGDQKTSILTEMFNDEFENMAAEMADSYGFSFNTAALKRYDPFNIKF